MSSCHENYKEFELKNKNIILVGNPNAGKSVFFHKLTGMYTNVSNYPGTTLQIIQGTYEDYTVVDSPGVYGLSSISLEEEITKKIVLKADKILNVVNALHLERELFLTLQLIDMGFPVVVALNFMDEVEKSNAIINIKELSKRLGVKVIPTVAIKGEGISEIKSSLSKVKPSKIQYDYNKGLPEHISKIKKRSEYILAIEGDPEILKKNGCNLKMSPDEVYQKRRKRVDEIVTAVQ